MILEHFEISFDFFLISPFHCPLSQPISPFISFLISTHLPQIKDITRYTALVVSVHESHVRLFDSYGAELTPNFKRNINCPNKLTHDQLSALVGASSPSAQLPKLLDSQQLAKLHPKVPGHFEFWVDDSVIRASKLSVGDEIRVKTAGNTILLTQAQQTSVTNFDKMEGGNVLNQVSKLTDRYTAEPEVLKQDKMEGVDESEWN